MKDETPNINALLESLAGCIARHMDERQRTEPLMVGIHTGGYWVAQYLHALLDLPGPLAGLNISFYRDDFSPKGLHPQVAPSTLPLDVNGRHVVLVDDVLYTGRTVRAAMNEIFDYGRPASITLAVLFSRTGRELPVQADLCGKVLVGNHSRQLKLTGPEPLRLSWFETEKE